MRRERPEEQENPGRKDYWKLHVNFFMFMADVNHIHHEPLPWVVFEHFKLRVPL